MIKKEIFYSGPVEIGNEIFSIQQKTSTGNKGKRQGNLSQTKSVSSGNNVSRQKKSIKINGIYKDIKYIGNKWVEKACSLALSSVKNGGGPFGALILQIDPKTNIIIRYWEGHNTVTKQNDPTAHAEVNAIRSACASLGVFNLGKIQKDNSLLQQPNEFSHCILISSCEPCPMCLSAAYWARIPGLYFAATRFDSAQPGVEFSDNEIYSEINAPYSRRKMKFFQCSTDNSTDAFELWKNIDKTPY